MHWLLTGTDVAARIAALELPAGAGSAWVAGESGLVAAATAVLAGRCVAEVYWTSDA